MKRCQDSLVAALRDVLGSNGCLTDVHDVAPYAVDWRKLCHGNTLCVARPASVGEVVTVVDRCREAGIAIVPQGGNTGLVAGSAPDGAEPALVLSLDRMTKIRSVDPIGLALTADAGCVLATAQEHAASAGCRLPLRLGAEGSCRLGGVVSTNAGGNLTIRFGNTRDLVLGLEVVLADGSVLSDLPGLRKNNAGYDLKQLFIGAEGTLGVVTGVSMKLVPAAADRVTALLQVTSLNAVMELLQLVSAAHASALTAFEMIPTALLDLVTQHVPGTRNPLTEDGAWAVLVELDTTGDIEPLRAAFEAKVAACFEDGRLTDGVIAADEAQASALWRLRESVTEAHRAAGYGLRHDISVPVAAMPAFIEHANTIVAGLVPDARILPFGHVGDGNVHYNLIAGTDDADGMRLREAASELSAQVHRLAVELGGSFSAEHGIGRLKCEDLADFRPDHARWGREIKRLFDPTGLFNPGVLWPTSSLTGRDVP